MRTSLPRLVALLIILCSCTASLRAADDAAVTFEHQIRSIFKVYCFDCHGGEAELSGGLDLRLQRFMVKGGDTGPAVIVGQPAESLLIQRMKSGEMPPGEKKVPADKIALIEQWIAAGAPVARAEPETLAPGLGISPEERAYWFYQPLQNPTPPELTHTVKTVAELAAQPNSDLVQTPIDAFLLARLREKQLRFAPPADKQTLIRRVTFDLLGLPPTPEEVAQFEADAAPDAYERLLDRLLQSPHYGERWGRHWLDVAGYADSEGNGSTDSQRPFNYRYRDYVIRALNADKPFNQFIIEQLAADEIVPRPWNNLTPEQADLIAATGFVRQVSDPTANGGVDEALGANQMVGDVVKVVSTSLLGLTVGCAQCHDHKYDPILQTDYYRLRAVFEPALDPAHWRRAGARLISLYTDADRAQAALVDAEVQKLNAAYSEKSAQYVRTAFEKELEKFPEADREKFRAAYLAPADQRTPEQQQILNSNPSLNINSGVLYQYNQAAADELKADMDKINAKSAERPVQHFVSLMDELPEVRPATKLFYRGDYRQPKQDVGPGDLLIAAPDGAQFDIADKDPSTFTSGRRLAYARHLMSGQHPLVGRVLVNRIWLQHFGRGIVDTPGDFGLLGLKPTHPELLDWLANEFVRVGWSLKQLHKTIMLSAAYQQSSVAHPDQPMDPRQVDGENTLLWHYPVKRLEAEALRDRMLMVSGRLDRTQFGPALPLEEDTVGQVVVQGDVPRRSVYLEVRRSKPVSFLTAFDAPVMTVNCERRVNSSGAPQALMLMNSDFVLKQAGAFAELINSRTPADFEQPLTAAFVARFPRNAEVWQFGYGAVDLGSQQVAFTPLTHFNGTNWQISANLPDPQHGWVLVRAQGGHPGDSLHAAIRRWIAPQAGKLAIQGQLAHGSENGDGVRGRIVAGKSGLRGEWSVANRSVDTVVAEIAVEAGEAIDFVTDCITNENSDSFDWRVQLTLTPTNGGAPLSWASETGFHGPVTAASLPQQIAYAWQQSYLRPITAEELELACEFVTQQADIVRSTDPKANAELSALTSLCQQLFSSNEFLYVD